MSGRRKWRAETVTKVGQGDIAPRPLCGISYLTSTQKEGRGGTPQVTSSSTQHLCDLCQQRRTSASQITDSSVGSDPDAPDGLVAMLHVLWHMLSGKSSWGVCRLTWHSQFWARGCSRCLVSVLRWSKMSLQLMLCGSGKHSWGFPQIYTPPKRISARAKKGEWTERLAEYSPNVNKMPGQKIFTNVWAPVR